MAKLASGDRESGWGREVEVMMLEVIASIELEMVAIMMLVILVMTIPDESKNV